MDFLYCLVCLQEILLHKKNQNMEEIQGGHCPCSKIQGGQPTTLPPPCRAPDGDLIGRLGLIDCSLNWVTSLPNSTAAIAWVVHFPSSYILVKAGESAWMRRSPAYILTISPRFTVAPCVFTQRLRKTIRRINSRLRRRCVNTGGATVNRDEIVSMYAGLNAHRILFLYNCEECRVFV